MAASDHPLGRCKSYLAAFSAIDAAIEAADPDVSRDEFRRARSAVVEKIFDQQEGEARDDELCQLLDQAMVESLLTLQIIPVEPATLTKTELVRSLHALKKQGSECVRALVRDVMRGWRASLQRDLERVRDMLSQIDHITMEIQMQTTETASKNPSQQKMVGVSVSGGGTAADAVQLVVNKKKTATDLVTVAASHSTKTATLDQLVMNKKKTTAAQWTKTGTLDHPVVNMKKTATDLVTHAVSVALLTKSTTLDQPVMVNKKTTASAAGGDLGGSLLAKMEASKRKLREGYQDVENAKRQRKIQIIKAPEMVKQKEMEQHPIFRERSRARYAASSTTVRRSVFRSTALV
ncbi:hypothetical protein U9M48_021017 [Paspalum notatum var. saurae]|uniref:TFIIS N-terminal domain-containing protein n=1 Tax=Paspalum notatum var. saurae TaxID=547442 RepID=A0AAQ3TEM5_PASNO